MPNKKIKKIPDYLLKNPLPVLLIAAIFALSFAYISQFAFGYEPCPLCLYQRKPFFAIIAAILFSLTVIKSKKFKNYCVIFCGLMIAINVGLSFYHVGVEEKVFSGLSTCSSQNLEGITNVSELAEILSKTKAVRCDEPSFFFLGLSMAAWNLVYCLILAIFLLLSKLYRLRIRRK